MIEIDLLQALETVCPRAYAVTLPQDVQMPAIRYLVINDDPKQAANTGEILYRSARVQVDVFAKTYEEAKSLKDEVFVKAIDLKAGSLSAQDLYDQESGLHRQLIDFTIRR